MHSGCIDELTIFIIAYAGGKFNGKRIFCASVPCLFFPFLPEEGRIRGAGPPAFQNPRRKNQYLPDAPAFAASEVQVLFFLPAHMNLHGRHNSMMTARENAIPRMARVLAGIRMLAAVPSFEVMSWRGAGVGACVCPWVVSA